MKPGERCPSTHLGHQCADSIGHDGCHFVKGIRVGTAGDGNLIAEPMFLHWRDDPPPAELRALREQLERETEEARARAHAAALEQLRAEREARQALEALEAQRAAEPAPTAEDRPTPTEEPQPAPSRWGLIEVD